MPNRIKIAVAGATGYVGLDLVFLLSKHPNIKIVNLCSTKNIGKKIFYICKRKQNITKTVKNILLLVKVIVGFSFSCRSNKLMQMLIVIALAL